jgi:hypothetical protein
MGYIKHNTIVVTGYEELIKKVHEKAIEIFSSYDDGLGRGFELLVSNIVHSLTNYTSSFFIAPDGSKEGWETDRNGDLVRGKFIEYLKNKSVDYFEVRYGGDDDSIYIINNSES